MADAKYFIMLWVFVCWFKVGAIEPSIGLYSDEPELKDLDSNGGVLMENGHVYSSNGTKAWTKCKEYYSTLRYACRKAPRLYVRSSYDSLDGVYAKADEFPHMALLGYGLEPHSAQWLCGGSVISERFILSAAHCASAPKWGKVTFAALGILKRTDLDDFWRLYKIKTIIVHPEFRPPSKYHDIMLLETVNDINFSPSILPACLDTGRAYDGTLIATGWGRQGRNGEVENHLQAIELNKYEDSLCSELFPPHRLFVYGYDNATQMCYGRTDKIVDTCQGDSGGPLQAELSPDCLYHILGITSFGRNCGTLGNAGMYTRVSYYVPWIESIVWNGDCLNCY